MSDCTRTEERLVELLDGALAPDAHAALEAHLTTCPTCRETARLNSAILEAYASQPNVDGPSDCTPGILSAAREAPGGLRPRRGARVLLAAAAVVLIGFVLSRALPEPASEDPNDAVTELILRGDTLREAQELERALAAYEQALAGARDDEAAGLILHKLAATLVALEKFDRALARLDELFARSPGDPQRGRDLLLQAEALEGMGAWLQALELYQLIAVDSPDESAEAVRRAQGIEALMEENALRELEALGYSSGD